MVRTPMLDIQTHPFGPEDQACWEPDVYLDGHPPLWVIPGGVPELFGTKV
jgi:hypothetical protein